MSKGTLPSSLACGSHDEMMEMFQRLYELDENPIFAIEAYKIAHVRLVTEGTPIPSWILDHLEQGFSKYLAARSSRSLDECLGVSRGRGKENAYSAAARMRNWYRLMVELKRLRTQGLSVEDAAAELEDRIKEAPVETDPEYQLENEPELYTAETIQSTYTHTWARILGDELE